MAIYNLFSTRQKKARGEVIDVYQYENMPNSLRVQTLKIIEDTIGYPSAYNINFHTSNIADSFYEKIHNTLSKEYGVFSLKQNYLNDLDALSYFFLEEKNVEKCMDFVELCMKIIQGYVSENQIAFRGITKQKPDDAIEELNERFRNHGFGYQFESGEIIRVDSQIIHSEIVKPILMFLGNDPIYQGANDEFLSAHEHYRHKRYKECLSECLKSFESLMKAIHDKHNWHYETHHNASKLINSCFSHNLVPSFLQSQFTSLKTMLESGVPTIRNNCAGHGQGADIKEVSEEMVSYMLHLTATNLLFLSKCEQNLIL